MSTGVQKPSQPEIGKPTPLPPDDPGRDLLVVDPDSSDVPYISLGGNTYTMLVTGKQTNGAYCLIDMHVPAGGGPPLHRHNFEEMFTIVDGSVDFFFRDTTTTVSAGTTINVPANAPHHFRNNSGRTARMLCVCAPAGQDEYFLRCGDPVDSRTAPPPALSEDEIGARRQQALDLAPLYASELLPPDGK
ncbi:cupin domain-containing protein [Micromonospora sp. BQ11]|uniref:cupin domain-containing protein n=1 Tax=Micromonospora sp. BQ11 TaxID=3452212 RepID=UPI003F8B8DCD